MAAHDWKEASIGVSWFWVCTKCPAVQKGKPDWPLPPRVYSSDKCPESSLQDDDLTARNFSAKL